MKVTVIHITVILSDKEHRYSIPYCQYLICDDMSLTCYWELTKAWYRATPAFMCHHFRKEISPCIQAYT